MVFCPKESPQTPSKPTQLPISSSRWSSDSSISSVTLKGRKRQNSLGHSSPCLSKITGSRLSPTIFWGYCCLQRIGTVGTTVSRRKPSPLLLKKPLDWARRISRRCGTIETRVSILKASEWETFPQSSTALPRSTARNKALSQSSKSTKSSMSLSSRQTSLIRLQFSRSSWKSVQRSNWNGLSG